MLTLAQIVMECCGTWGTYGATMICMQAFDGSTLAAGYQDTESASDGMVLITVLLCTLVRGAKLQEAKVGNVIVKAAHDAMWGPLMVPKAELALSLL